VALRDPGAEIVDALNANLGYARGELREVMLKLTLLRQGPLAGMFDRPRHPGRHLGPASGGHHLSAIAELPAPTSTAEPSLA